MDLFCFKGSIVRIWCCPIRKLYKTNNIKKPIIGFIAGETAPKGRTMGHAGAIVGGSEDTAKAKKIILRDCGINVVDSPAEIGMKVAELLVLIDASLEIKVLSLTLLSQALMHLIDKELTLV